MQPSGSERQSLELAQGLYRSEVSVFYWTHIYLSMFKNFIGNVPFHSSATLLSKPKNRPCVLMATYSLHDYSRP